MPVLQESAFVSEYPSLSDKLKNDVSVVCGGKTTNAVALWDTGASRTCISKDVATGLGLVPLGKQLIHTPSGTLSANTYQVDVVLPNNVVAKNLVVCDSEIGSQQIGVLIGMDIITRGDFAVSNFNGKTVFTFRIPSAKKTDYVAEQRFRAAIGQKHGKGKRKHGKI